MDAAYVGSVTIAITPNTGAPGATITAGTVTQAAVAGVLIVHGVHFFDRIEEADDEGRAEFLAGADGAAAEFFY